MPAGIPREQRKFRGKQQYKCAVCGAWKNKSLFPTDKRSKKHGVRADCKDCNNEARSKKGPKRRGQPRRGRPPRAAARGGRTKISRESKKAFEQFVQPGLLAFLDSETERIKKELVSARLEEFSKLLGTLQRSKT